MQYDYIIIGGGLSGLMLAEALLEDDYFQDKTILLIEKAEKNTNDKTWCFWSTSTNKYTALARKRWSSIVFKDTLQTLHSNINPYQYCQINSIDFYTECYQKVAKASNCTLVYDEVLSVKDVKTNVVVKTKNKEYAANKVFSSIFNYSQLSGTQYPVLQQHFIGWKIETEQAVFDADVATFMDFSVPQNGNTRFMYVLPTSAHEALVEYTLFSQEMLPKQEYEKAIENYLIAMGIEKYSVTEKESGSIPMTAYPFHQKNSANVLHIGTAGGFTKASTGYTFQSTLKKTTQIITFLKQPDVNFTQLFKPNRFSWYDSILLEVLDKENEKGSRVFSKMFQHNSITTIFKFLDEETSLKEEIKLIFTLPKLPFLKAVFRRMRY